MFLRIWIVSSTVVGSTMIFWNRRSSAPSFSMYCRYSSSVVAPMHCSSPRESAGLNMLEASSEPDAPPAPTIVCSSSMNRMTSLAFSSSFITAFIRSSNWPAVLRAGDERGKVERDDPFAVEDPGDLLLHDPHRQAFGDRGLADAGFADEHRIVLLPAAQDLRHPFDFLLAADDRVELVLGRELREVVAEVVEHRRLGFFRLLLRCGAARAGESKVSR